MNRVGRTGLFNHRGLTPSEVSLGLIPIVRAAAQLDVIDCWRAAGSMGHHVMEFQEAPLRAATAILADKRAPPLVPAPDFTLHRGRDAPRAVGDPTTRARAVRSSQLFPGKVFKQRSQGPIDDPTDIAVGNLMAQEVLRAPQLRVGLSAGRELMV